MSLPRRLGATVTADSTRFEVWAPRAASVEVELPAGQRVAMEPLPRGYHRAEIPGVVPGTRYRYVLDGDRPRRDPAGRAQPEGVHGPSAVVDPAFDWTDADWRTPPLSRFIVYELHVGTFTRSGTFAAAIEQLDRLVELGVTAVELMPVAQFPGARNWGYDGVCPFAVHGGYGGAAGLAAFVDAAHARGLAVILDVVYNHLGPEGNVLHDFGPYFTERYRTPWGPAMNFDGPHSDEVRRYFVENALMWLEDFHVDALRLDAVHAIFDASPHPFLAELAEHVEAFATTDGRARYLVAESDANDPRLLRPRSQDGVGMDAVWADDMHHALHVLLTGEREGYYADYGDRELLAEAVRHGFAYRGQYSRFRRRRHGASGEGLPPSAFVVCAQNHDQVGNRARGDRLGRLTTPAGQRLAAGLVLTSAHVPLLFMGQEYGETRPFAYFTSHGDPELAEAVRRGRKAEFAAFAWAGELPDPQSPTTFEGSKLRPEVSAHSPHRELLALYRDLIRLRREHVASIVDVPPGCTLRDDGRTLTIELGRARDLVLVANLEPDETRAPLDLARGLWTTLVDAEDPRYGGAGSVLHATVESATTIDMPGFWFALLLKG